MDYHRISSIDDPLFRQMHGLMQQVFPPEEVLAYELWREPLADPGISDDRQQASDPGSDAVLFRLIAGHPTCRFWKLDPHAKLVRNGGIRAA